ncbi:MAG: hypothetical protein ABI597_09790 [Gammaproteobacteria bacterium]
MTASSKIFSLLDAAQAEVKVEATPIDYTSFLKSSPLLQVDVAKWRMQPNQVWMCKKTSETGAMSEYSVSVDEIEKAKNFKWIEGIIVSSELNLEIAAARQKPPFNSTCYQFKNYLENVDAVNDKIVLFEYEDKNFGYTTFSRCDINVTDFMGFYAGKIVRTGRGYKGPGYYTLQTDLTVNLPGHYAIDGEDIGNISRFLPHLVSDKELAELVLPPEIDKARIATSNLRFKQIVINDIEISLLEPKRDIPAHELIGINYGPEYWNKREFWLCYKDGTQAVKVKYVDEKLVLVETKKQKLTEVVTQEDTADNRDKKRFKSRYEIFNESSTQSNSPKNLSDPCVEQDSQNSSTVFSNEVANLFRKK